MKRLAILAGLLLLACDAFGQTGNVNCNGYTGHLVLGSGPAYVDCGSAPVTPPPCNPPNTVNAAGQCVPPVTPIDPSQCNPATPSFNGIPNRQCSGSTFWPSKPQNNLVGTPFVSLFTVLRGSWSDKKAYTGQPFTFSVAPDSYVSLAFTATDATHSLQVSYNQTSGQGGKLFWMSTTPGGPPRGTAFEQCAGTSSASLIIYPIQGYACSVVVGQTVYLNWTPDPGDARPISYLAY